MVRTGCTLPRLPVLSFRRREDGPVKEVSFHRRVRPVASCYRIMGGTLFDIFVERNTEV